jgi:hypothetical protein
MRRSLFLIFLFLICPISAEAAGRPTQSYQLTYDVYAGGLHALKANLTIQYEPTKYKADLKANTYGLLKKLADWHGLFSTDGWSVSSTQHRPRLHFSEAVWRGEVERKDFYYNRDGSFKSYKVTNQGKNETPSEMDVSLAKGTTDILSATLDVMSDLRQKHKCNVTRRIFDGDRNFDMSFVEKGAEILAKTDYNIYVGPSLLCTVEVKPRDGKWHKKPRGWLSIQEQGRKAQTLPTIWFAKVGTDKNALYVPVKLRVKTDYGTLFMHLTSYKDNKTTINSKTKK